MEQYQQSYNQNTFRNAYQLSQGQPINLPVQPQNMYGYYPSNPQFPQFSQTQQYQNPNYNQLNQYQNSNSLNQSAKNLQINQQQSTMGYPIKKQNMIEQLYLQNNQQQPQTLHNTPGLQNSMRLAGQNIMQNQSQFSQQKLGQSQSQPDLQRNLNNNSYPQKFPFFVPPEEEPQKFERYGFRVQDIYAPYSPKRFMPSHVEQSLNQEIDELSAHLREIKPHVIKAPPSYLLNDTMSKF